MSSEMTTQDSQLLPCNSDGLCMRCKSKPPPEDSLTCVTCVTPWHVSCLSSPPETLASTLNWLCPDCSGIDPPPHVSVGVVDYESEGSAPVAAIRAIEADESLNDEEKALKRQRLFSGKGIDGDDGEENKKSNVNLDGGVLSAVENLNCSFCLLLPETPVTTPCGHNSCLKCFKRWVGQGGRTCGKCRTPVPDEMARNPSVNLSLMLVIQKISKSDTVSSSKVNNEDLPDKAFTTERAKKPGNANAAGGKIFVTIPSDHFGPITAEYDPSRKRGVLVGDSWENRLECRQWGAHFPHVSGIAGQSNHGAQSVVLSGGYEDDEDHGEWFLYTGSGGRDLSNNKRTNKVQSFDQDFNHCSNAALKLSCKLGYPVRVLRSGKQKSSAYAPETGVRYDGVYRIEKCWRKVGIQGSFMVCRYLFVRCDNQAAPWTQGDGDGDRPRPLPDIPELNIATDLFEREESPSWDFDEGEGRWRWIKPPPASNKAMKTAHSNTRTTKLLKEFNCPICRQVMTLPVTTPCAHNFCKPCLESKFSGTTLVRERTRGTRTLRTKKNVMKCPCCPSDISDFLQNPQVNREVMEVIEKLKKNKEDNTKPVDEREDSEEEPLQVVSEEDIEQPEKRVKLDTYSKTIE